MTTTKRQKQHASDQDELPIQGAGKGHGPRKPPHPKGEKGYTGRLDPDMYARLSRPWPSREAGHVAMSSFLEEAHELRIKHGIADVTILAAITVNDNGKQVGFMESHHSGDVRNQLAMVAAAFRTLREQNDEEARAMAGLAAPDIVPLTPDGTRMVERITAAMQDRLEAGQVWTPLDTMNALMANEAMRAETHGALLDLVGQGPRSPAEEIGALRGALGEILSVATARVERITRRVREIEAEHPDLKVPPFSDPAIERENRESLERQHRAAAGVAAPATPVMTPKERDLADAQKHHASVKWYANTATPENSLPDALAATVRSVEDYELAIAMHHDQHGPARETLRARLDLLKGYLMLWGGTDFLKACREAIAEERWYDLVREIAGVENALVSANRLRRTVTDAGWIVEPVVEGRWHIPTDIDPGGPLL